MRKTGLLLLTCILCIQTLFCMQTKAAENTDVMKITAVDLGADNSGEAAMITDGDKNSILVDTGDPHNDAIIQWLDKNGYKDKEFDVLITHWHDDHAGNAAKIISRYNVGTVYLPTFDYIYSDDTDYYRYQRSYVRKVLDAAKNNGTKVIYIRRGQEIDVGSVKGKVLYCCGSLRSENDYNVQYINNQSAVIMFIGGGARFLACGDLQTEVEERLVGSGIDLRADIYKMSHHGLDTSNSTGFVEKVDPEVSYFTSYTATPSKMISKDVEGSVSRVSPVSDILSTRYNGTIVFTCSDGKITTETERNSTHNTKILPPL